METLHKTENMQYERCVRCGKETEYIVDTPVTIRYRFVDGAGQLCRDCYEKSEKQKEIKKDGK